MSNIQITENESGKYSPEWFYNEAQKPKWIAFIRKADTLHENFINHFGIEHLKSLSGKELLTSLFLIDVLFSYFCSICCITLFFALSMLYHMLLAESRGEC